MASPFSPLRPSPAAFPARRRCSSAHARCRDSAAPWYRRSRSSLIMDLFTEPGDRAKAMGVYGFVCAGGGSLGVLAGGMLTSAAGWHWVFLVNLSIGIAVYALCRSLIAETGTQAAAGRLDVGGAVTVTTSLMLAVYAIVNGNDAGWRSARTLGLLAAAAVLAAVFLLIESRVRNPLMPLRLLRLRNLSTANVVD